LDTNGINILNTYTQDKINLVTGSCAVFKRFLKEAVTRHIREGLALRVNKVGSDGKTGRKDLLGISPCLDDHAIHYASSARITNEFLKVYPEIMAQQTQTGTEGSGDKTDSSGRGRGLWKRYLSTILSGACRFGDRLFAANLVPNGKCTHPACRNKVITAEHWLYECPYNIAARQSTGGAIRELIVETGKSQRNGPSRARIMKEIIDVPCLKNSGNIRNKVQSSKQISATPFLSPISTKKCISKRDSAYPPRRQRLPKSNQILEQK
jgi:hypothetical protein